MIIKPLLRRLERLEMRLLLPDRGVMEHQIVFVDADGTETGSMVMKFSHCAPSHNWRSRRAFEDVSF
jgi:hypothetical protein